MFDAAVNDLVNDIVPEELQALVDALHDDVLAHEDHRLTPEHVCDLTSDSDGAICDNLSDSDSER